MAGAGRIRHPWCLGAGILAAGAILVAVAWRLLHPPAPTVDCSLATSMGTSVLAVGDTGQPPTTVAWLDTRLSVARAMDEAHRLDPVDGLLLLGDNFYPDGLTSADLAWRLRVNIVEPYCRFLSLTGLHQSELASSCPLDPQERIPTPILAVLGNHDYGIPGSGDLEKFELPHWLPEWSSPQAVADLHELPGGLSVIALDSVKLHEGADWEPVRAALRSSRGPWRIVIAHHPLYAHGEPWEERYAAELMAAIRETNRPIHMMLTGHEHLLATAVTGKSELPLQVVVGSGARARSAQHELLGETAAYVHPGFARLDLVQGEGGVELRASLIATAWLPLERQVQPRPIACLSVTADGRVRDLSRDRRDQ